MKRMAKKWNVHVHQSDMKERGKKKPNHLIYDRVRVRLTGLKYGRNFFDLFDLDLL